MSKTYRFRYRKHLFVDRKPGDWLAGGCVGFLLGILAGFMISMATGEPEIGNHADEIAGSRESLNDYQAMTSVLRRIIEVEQEYRKKSAANHASKPKELKLLKSDLDSLQEKFEQIDRRLASLEKREPYRLQINLATPKPAATEIARKPDPRPQAPKLAANEKTPEPVTAAVPPKPAAAKKVRKPAAGEETPKPAVTEIARKTGTNSQAPKHAAIEKAPESVTGVVPPKLTAAEKAPRPAASAETPKPAVTEVAREPFDGVESLEPLTIVEPPKRVDLCTVSGKVVDVSGVPYPKVKVNVDDTYSAVTDESGEFVIIDVPRGEHQIRALSDGSDSGPSRLVVNEAVVTVGEIILPKPVRQMFFCESIAKGENGQNGGAWQIIGQADAFATDVGRVTCFTQIVGAQRDTTIKHRWFWNSQLESEVPLKVKGLSWRTYSQKLIDKSGNWRVEVTRADDHAVLASREFVVQ